MNTHGNNYMQLYANAWKSMIYVHSYVFLCVDFHFECLDLYLECLDLYFECLDLYFECLDLCFGCLYLYFGCLDLYFGCLDLWLGPNGPVWAQAKGTEEQQSIEIFFIYRTAGGHLYTKNLNQFLCICWNKNPNSNIHFRISYIYIYIYIAARGHIYRTNQKI